MHESQTLLDENIPMRKQFKDQDTPLEQSPCYKAAIMHAPKLKIHQINFL